jgi:hypothetical protein
VIKDGHHAKLHMQVLVKLQGRKIRWEDVVVAWRTYLCALDLCAGRNDLCLSRALALGGHGQTVLQLLREDDVLDEHGLDVDAPAGGGFLDDFADGRGDFLAALDDVLQDAGADDVAEGGLCALDEGLADVGDAEGGLVRRGDAIVDDRVEVQRDVVLGHADLLRDLCCVSVACTCS